MVFAVTEPPVSTPVVELLVAGPEVTLQVAPVAAEVVPSLQFAVAVYVPVPPSFTEAGPLIVMLLKVTGAELIVSENAFVEESPAPVTCTVKLYVPAVVGVPLRTPAALRDRPGGAVLPAAMAQV